MHPFYYPEIRSSKMVEQYERISREPTYGARKLNDGIQLRWRVIQREEAKAKANMGFSNVSANQGLRRLAVSHADLEPVQSNDQALGLAASSLGIARVVCFSPNARDESLTRCIMHVLKPTVTGKTAP